VEKKRSISDYFPLLLIFLYLLLATFLFKLKAQGSSFREEMLFFMGLFFMVFSFFKFLDYRGFVLSFREYDPLGASSSFYAWLYPFVELFLGIGYLMAYHIYFLAWLTIIVLSINIIGVLKVYLDEKKVRCACLGTTIQLPLTLVTLAEDLLMILMAISLFLT